MIIRRRRTRNFTILENEVVEDKRLALDEIGLLAWLRSRPDHWEVSRAAIGSRFKIGRDRVARIFQSLIEAGWMIREDTLPGEPARYLVMDQPGAKVELTPESVANLSQSDQPSTGDPLPDSPSTENPATHIRTDSKQESSPLPPSFPVEPKQGALQGEKAGKTESKPETPKPVSKFYGRYSPEGAAIRVIAALRGESDVPDYWQRQDPVTRRAGYWVPFELTPRLIGLGQLEQDGPIKHYNWPRWLIGSQEAGAWRGLLKSIGLELPKNVGNFGASRGVYIRAPWPFPPRADGSLSMIEDATGPPVIEPMSEKEAREFAGG